MRAEEQPLPSDGARVARASRFVARASWQEAFRQSADQEEVTSHQQQVISQPEVEKKPSGEEFASAASRVAASALEEVVRQRELVERRERLGGAK